MSLEANIARSTSCLRLFQMLDTQGQQRVIGAIRAVYFRDGAKIVEEGAPGDALYIILSGKAEVSVDDLGEQKVLCLLIEGAMFGEMAVITNQPRSATVMARGPVAALRIQKDDILAILKDYPKVREQIARIGVARAEDTLDKLIPVPRPK
jgi:CRP/FNR family transcriptional regulator, cyclic AMP receptor protein